MNIKKIVKVALTISLTVFILIQFIQPDRENPTVNPAETLQVHSQMPREIDDLFTRGCKDCHSNESQWPFYSYIAPVSWLISYDVTEGRKHFNMSEWGTYSDGKKLRQLSGIAQVVSEGLMPLPKYIPLHPEADFSEEERTVLSSWAQREAEKMINDEEE